MPGAVADGVNEEETVGGLDGKPAFGKEDQTRNGIKEEEAVGRFDGKSTTPPPNGYGTLNGVKEEEAVDGLDRKSNPNGASEGESSGGLDGKSAPLKEYQAPSGSPGHNSNPHSRQDTAQNFPVEGIATHSIEQLYKNVCDMESSDQSPSRNTFGSDGDESRIDSELHHLVGGEMREVEIIKEEMAEKPEDDSGSSSSSKRESSSTGKKSDKVPSKIEKSIPAIQAVQNLEVSSKRSPKARTQPKNSPLEKRSENSPRKEILAALARKGTVPLARVKSKKGNDGPSESGVDNSDQAPLLLKQARELISSGDNLQKALDLALKACKSYESCINEKKCLELVMCLHVTAAIYCSLGRHEEAIPILERSIMIPEVQEGQQHGLAKFAGHMQLGDTYAVLGQLENAISCYEEGLEVQNRILGESDPRLGETCRYLAEAHVQALQFDEAQRVCQMALDIHEANGSDSLEAAADRRLMGLICETKGDHEAALHHLISASKVMKSNDQEVEVASVDLSIGDNYLALSSYDVAIASYQKALTTFKSSKGENHPAVGTVFVCLAELYNRTGKFKESQSYCENALKIFEKPTRGVPPEEIATGLTNIAAIYESMKDIEQALKLLHKALKIYNDVPGQQSTVAGIEAQMGVMYYVLGDYSGSYDSFKNAVSKLRAVGDRKSAFFGIALNQMGLACVQRFALNEAIECFEEARTILEKEYGPYHPDTLGVYSNLAGTYDAVGRLEEAIEILEYVVGMREEKLGTANPDVDDEKRRLSELLKEAGRVRTRTARSLENLLDSNGLKDNALLHA